MRSLKGGDFVVLGPPDLGTRVAYFAGGRTVGSMYWEAWRGLKSASDFWTSETDQDARLVLSDYSVDFVISENRAPAKIYRNGELVTGKTLGQRISEGDVPAWLEPVEWEAPAGSNFKLFRVNLDKFDQESAGVDSSATPDTQVSEELESTPTPTPTPSNVEGTVF